MKLLKRVQNNMNILPWELSELEDPEYSIDCMDGLKLIYEGKDVEGEVIEYKEPKNTVMREIVFSLQGKKYKFYVEEITD